MGTILAPNRRLPKVKPAVLAQRSSIPKLEVHATSLLAAIFLIITNTPYDVAPFMLP